MALISSAPSTIAASRYARLRWHIEGLQPQTDIRFAWTTPTAPMALREAPLQPSGKGTGELHLDSLPHWQGSITGVGLIVYGPLAQPLILHKLELLQPTPGIGALLVQLWNEWTILESWSQRSINFIAGTSPQALLPPVPAVAAWIGLSALLYSGLLLIQRRSWTMMPFATLFLVGWLVLDARWQWNLWRQADLTLEQYAGKNGEEKSLVAADGQLFQFILEVKKKMPPPPVRVFLLTADPADKTRYIRSRAHFHLLPHNVNSSLSSLPVKARKSDYILILGSIPNLRYDPQTQTLRMTQGKTNPIAVEIVYKTSNGVLFSVRDGDANT
jgi:hypothetical protein